MQDRTPECLGPYRLLRRLGEGGMGVVYLATDARGAPVAVKALHPQMAGEENARRRLAREVETMRRVRSRYVAEVVDADLSGHPPYIVTRYVPGLTLDDVVDSGGPLSGPPLARLAYGLAEALAAIHSAGVVHRDLKPGNVMISDGEPVVIDFGIAQLPETTRLTMTGMFMGTPGYLAPEVIEGQDSGTASDVHSLAATLAFAATGRPPFGSGNFEAIFFRIMHGMPDLDTLPAPLTPLVHAALARDPAHRPSAAQIAQQIAVLNPAALVPSPSVRGGTAGAAAGPLLPPGGLPRTMTDGPAPPGWPRDTMPLSAPADAGDVRDLLPPVSYLPPGPAGGGPAHAGHGAPGAGADLAGPAGFAAGNGYPGTVTAAPGWPGGAAGSGTGWPGGPDGAGPHGPNGTAMADGWERPAAFGQPPGGGSPFAGGAEPLLPGPAAGPGVGPAAGGPAAARRSGPVSAWSPLVLAAIAVAAAVAVMAPIVGTAAALVALVALRAATTTGRHLARRRSGDGRRASDPVVAAAFYPVAVLRSLIGLVLLSPVALLAFCVAVAATIIAVPSHPLSLAVALGAGALVAIVGIGPGSSGSRMALARFFGAVARTRSRLAIAYVGVLALALWAVLDASAQARTAAFWPVTSLHAQIVHMPTVRMILTDVRQNLLRIARQIGL